MAILEWDKTGERFYESGVSKVVLYTPKIVDNIVTDIYGKASAWNGVTSVNESPDGADPNDLWADNIKYASLYSAETFGFTIEAYTYPTAWNACNGFVQYQSCLIGQQDREQFGLCYRTEKGNDTISKKDDSYLLHLIYGAMAQPSDRDYETINDSPDAIQFSWECTTTPVKVGTITGSSPSVTKPISTIVIDTAKLQQTPEKLQTLIGMLYGTEDDDARLPSPEEIIRLFG